MKLHPDFNQPWCKALLEASSTSDITVPERAPARDPPQGLGTTFFLKTLYTDSAIRAQINFRRQARSSDAITPTERCTLFSLGDGVDGKTGRAHGGFSSLIIDHMTGWVAAQESGSIAPATATMTVDYKAPVDTPIVILCRAWLVERSGRKYWVRAVIEDGEGRVLAQGKSLFIAAKDAKI